jgi:predicted small lipoprotein YifL
MNMTLGRGGAIGRRFVAAAFIAAVALAGCASTEPSYVPTDAQSGAVDTGTYPNLNIPPHRAAEAMTPEDAAAVTATVDGARARQAAAGRGAGTKGDPMALKRIAAQHGDDTLAAISAQQ